VDRHNSRVKNLVESELRRIGHRYMWMERHILVLNELAGVDPRKAQVVELRYFVGMSVEETAEALGVHPNTVIRDWSLAKVWLRRELSPKGAHAG